MWSHKFHNVAAPSSSLSLFPLSKGKVLCKKRGGRIEYLTLIWLWQVMFCLKLHCTRRAQSGKWCNLRADLVQHMHEHPRQLLQLSLDPRDLWICLHLPLSHIKFSISSAVAGTPWCTYEAFDTNVDLTRLCHLSLNMDLLLFSLAITLFVTLSLTPHSFPLTLNQRGLNVCSVS